MLENDANQASLLDPLTDPPRGKYRAQWNDDYHHVFHVLLTGETAGYYGDYREPAGHVARTLAEGFVYQGEPSPHRKGETRGEPTSALPATAFVNFLQNHDQIGNRALGERLSVLAPPAALEAALAVTLLAPAPPLMFMGDEWGAREPFPFFCDFKGDLADAVRNGRRTEFAEAYARYQGEVPDPLSEKTVRLATLDWAAIDKPRTSRAARSRAAAARGAKILCHPAPAATSARSRPCRIRRRRADGAMDLRLGRNAVDAGQSQRAVTAAARCVQAGEPVWGGAPPARTAAMVGLCRDRGRRSAVDIPLSTYRLQLSKDFGFDDAARIVPYLKSLGITHLYTSPFLKARPGSPHGYDVVDYGALNPEFGGEDAFARLERRAEERRARPDPRLRAQPHGGRLRQRLVDGRAGVGPEIAARGVVRHQLGAVALPA